uniref:Uncharacterized protein n=2 Tax=Panagrolaimus sp. PS1159 TaxID=55785 RepID=A0AC35EX49_9BILA
MVCLPCIILPVCLAIYLRFIQPLILRFVPEGWKQKFDAYLYPTCPIKRQPVAKADANETEAEEVKDGADTTCCNSDSKFGHTQTETEKVACLEKSKDD